MYLTLLKRRASRAVKSLAIKNLPLGKSREKTLAGR